MPFFLTYLLWSFPQSCLIAVVVPELHPVEQWADKNGVQGDMESFCTNEVFFAEFDFGGKYSAATGLSYRREILHLYVLFLAGNYLRWWWEMFGGNRLYRREKYIFLYILFLAGKLGGNLSLLAGNIFRLYVLYLAGNDSRCVCLFSAGNDRRWLVCYWWWWEMFGNNPSLSAENILYLIFGGKWQPLCLSFSDGKSATTANSSVVGDGGKCLAPTYIFRREISSNCMLFLAGNDRC